MIKYDIYKTPSPIGQEKELFHARAVTAGTVSYDKLKEDIAHATTATPADISLVVESIVSQIEQHLAQGRNVQLGELGTFSVGISGPSATNKKDINATKLEVSDVHFRPKKKLIKNINMKAKFESVRYKRHSSEYSDTEIEALLADHFRNSPYITRREFESLCGLTRTTACRRLRDLSKGDHPLLCREGPRNSTIYVPAATGCSHTQNDTKIIKT
jgi:predicted histone-like DNA-binding protein